MSTQLNDMTLLTQGELRRIVTGEDELMPFSRWCKRWNVSKNTAKKHMREETIVAIRRVDGRIYLRASEGLKLLHVAEL
jgi:hypothetical protein